MKDKFLSSTSNQVLERFFIPHNKKSIDINKIKANINLMTITLQNSEIMAISTVLIADNEPTLHGDIKDLLLSMISNQTQQPTAPALL